MPEWVDGHTTGYYYELDRHKYISQRTYNHNPERYNVKSFTNKTKKEHAHEYEENYGDVHYEETYDILACDEEDYNLYNKNSEYCHNDVDVYHGGRAFVYPTHSYTSYGHYTRPYTKLERKDSHENTYTYGYVATEVSHSDRYGGRYDYYDGGHGVKKTKTYAHVVKPKKKKKKKHYNPYSYGNHHHRFGE